MRVFIVENLSVRVWGPRRMAQASEDALSFLFRLPVFALGRLLLVHPPINGIGWTLSRSRGKNQIAVS